MPNQATIVRTVPALPARNPAMHKGNAGRLLVVAGSAGMAGAAALCSRAALRSGAGLVRLAMPASLTDTHHDPNVMTIALPQTPQGALAAAAAAKIATAAENVDVLLIGPGLSTQPQTVQAVHKLLPKIVCKLVVDADALNAIAGKPALLTKIPRRAGPPVLTPHPGEMLRLLGNEGDKLDLRANQAHRTDTAVAFARKHNVVVALKGHRTVVTDGRRAYVNTTGNPGMAKAGMGDVLAGVIAALMGQGFDSFDAATLGVFLHGLAGDMVCNRMGEYGMLATDVIEELPHAFSRHQKGQTA